MNGGLEIFDFYIVTVIFDFKVFDLSCQIYNSPLTIFFQRETDGSFLVNFNAYCLHLVLFSSQSYLTALVIVANVSGRVGDFNIMIVAVGFIPPIVLLYMDPF